MTVFEAVVIAMLSWILRYLSDGVVWPIVWGIFAAAAGSVAILKEGGLIP